MTERTPDAAQMGPLEEAGMELVPLHRWDSKRADPRTGRSREMGKAPTDANWTRRPYRRR